MGGWRQMCVIIIFVVSPQPLKPGPPTKPPSLPATVAEPELKQSSQSRKRPHDEVRGAAMFKIWPS